MEFRCWGMWNDQRHLKVLRFTLKSSSSSSSSEQSAHFTGEETEARKDPCFRLTKSRIFCLPALLDSQHLSITRLICICNLVLLPTSVFLEYLSFTFYFCSSSTKLIRGLLCAQVFCAAEIMQLFCLFLLPRVLITKKARSIIIMWSYFKPSGACEVKRRVILFPVSEVINI